MSESPPDSPPASPFRRRLGAAMIAVGIVSIVWSALYVSSAVQGQRAPRTFAERVSYDQAKERIHRSFPVGVSLGLGGLFLAMTGATLRRGPGAAR